MAEMIEGPGAFGRFKHTMKTLLAVSRDELAQREQAYKEQAAKNPRKRGQKPKPKSV